MPNRVRTIYQSQALYVGPSPATGQHFRQFGAESLFTGANLVSGLHRIQNCNYSFSVNRTPVQQFGQLAAIDRVILDTPTVDLSFSYLLANMWNEAQLGLVVDGRLAALSGILNKVVDERNYFLKIVDEGFDAVGDTSNDIDVAVVGFGNGFLASYSAAGAINSFPTVDIGIAALNMTFATGTSGKLPALNPENGVRVTDYHYVIPTATGSPGTGLLNISVLRPGDITLDFKKRETEEEGVAINVAGAYAAPGVNIQNAKIQSYNLSFDLSREPLQKLGSRFAFSREITFPVDVNFSVTALVGDLTTGSLAAMIDDDDSYDITVNLKKPAPPGDAQPVIARYHIKAAKMSSHSYSNGIGDNKTVTMDFASQIQGPQQQTFGLYLSGVTTPV